MLHRFTTLPVSHAKRLFSLSSTYGKNDTKSVIFSQLAHRAVVQLSGAETFEFLQGLVTNDVYEIDNDGKSGMYAMMLNTQGRVDYDLIITQIGSDAVLLDCNRSTLETFTKTIKRYKLRKKVKIEERDDLSVWQGVQTDKSDSLKASVQQLQNQDDNLICFEDPRTKALGYRLLSTDALDDSVTKASSDFYHNYRYKLGVPEGNNDLIQGKALPLESNVDFMNGVSFSKGCYIGQELTARTFHTGVVRKRLVPIEVLDNTSIEVGDRVYPNSTSKKSAGKVISVCGNVGLGLIRLNNLNSEPLFTKNGGQISCSRPSWWPSDEDQNK